MFNRKQCIMTYTHSHINTFTYKRNVIWLFVTVVFIQQKTLYNLDRFFLFSLFRPYLTHGLCSYEKRPTDFVLLLQTLNFFFDFILENHSVRFFITSSSSS